jgi:hypothetical protein
VAGSAVRFRKIGAGRGPCGRCDDARMVEYGGGISHGPAGQVSGGGGGSVVGGGSTDLFAPVGQFVGNAIHTLSALSPTELVILAAVVFVGLLILRRAL